MLKMKSGDAEGKLDKLNFVNNMTIRRGCWGEEYAATDIIIKGDNMLINERNK